MAVLVFFSDVGRIGIGICYDIRFQELAMMYAARGMPSSSSAFCFVVISLKLSLDDVTILLLNAWRVPLYLTIESANLLDI